MKNPAHPTKRTKLIAEKSQLGYMFKVGIILRDEYEYKKEFIEEQLLEISLLEDAEPHPYNEFPECGINAANRRELR